MDNKFLELQEEPGTLSELEMRKRDQTLINIIRKFYKH